MTAEIAILNRSGVALAADSAVTIGSKKVYNTANKLFSLSKYHPVGIMIYGGANFMGVPWETIIKTYRKYLGEKKKDRLKEYKDDFLAYIIKDKRLRNDHYENVIVGRTFYKALSSVVNEVQIYIEERISEGFRPKNEEVINKLNAYLEREIVHIQKEHDVILDLSKKTFIENYKKVIEAIAKEKINISYGTVTTDLMESLAYEAVIRNYFTQSYSGIVISGYGEEELFPCLYEFKIEGFILGELKYVNGTNTEIKASRQNDGPTASIVPFAQTEMVHTFMKGIDPSLNRNIKKLITDIISDLPSLIQEQTDVRLEDHEVLELRQWGKEYKYRIHQAIESHLTEVYSFPIIDIVGVLPKEELADMAEALVNLTSFKRRVSIDTETVGGPIDVAVITKGDGLIWIKRKHYFQPNLNYNFFQNYTRSDFDDTFNE